jgi:transcription initiation factor TFIIH subunit 4
VWYFILQYLDSLSERGMSLVECLSFLFQLSFSQLGKVEIKIHGSPGFYMFLGLPDPSERGTDPDPSNIKQKY